MSDETTVYRISPDGLEAIGYVSTSAFPPPTPPTPPEAPNMDAFTEKWGISLAATEENLRLVAEALNHFEKNARKTLEKMAENANRLPPPLRNRPHGPQPRRNIPPRKIGLHRTSYQR